MAGGISLWTRAEGREAARAPERSNTQVSSPVWELSPGVQGHHDPSVDVRDLSPPSSGSQKA